MFMHMLKPLAVVVVLTGTSFMSVAEAAPVVTQCGRLISSVTKTNIDFSVARHLVRISFQTGNSMVTANIGPWTNTVEVLE